MTFWLRLGASGGATSDNHSYRSKICGRTLPARLNGFGLTG